MAYRLIYSEFWTDPTTMEEMSIEDRYFYLYILTNPSTTSCGIYMITKKKMAFELGYSIENLNCLMDRFENTYKLIRYNTVTRELAIKNWGKYNLNRGGKPVMDCLISELSKVKDKTLIEYALNKINNGNIQEVFKSFTASSTAGERTVPPEDGNTDTGTEANAYTNTDRDTCLDEGEHIDETSYCKTDEEAMNSILCSKTEEKPKEEGNTIEVSSSTLALEEQLQNASIEILQKYEKLTGQIGIFNLAALKIAVEQHGKANVIKAIDTALTKGKLNMQYVNGILRTWAREGYPKEVIEIGGSYKNNGESKTSFKPREPNRLTKQQFKEAYGELL